MLSKMRLAYGDEIYVVILGVNPTPDWSRINNFAAETNHEGSALAATKETLETYGILKVTVEGKKFLEKPYRFQLTEDHD